MLGGDACDFACVRTQLRKRRQRAVRSHLLVGESQRDRGEIRFENGAGDPFVRNAGDDAGAAPLLHLRNRVIEVSGSDVKAPRAMKLGVAGDAAQHLAAKPAGGFHEQGDFRKLAHRRDTGATLRRSDSGAMLR
jgi:hypothetical protein